MGIVLYKLKQHNNSLVPYIPIMKCANKGINENLIRLSFPLLNEGSYVTNQVAWNDYKLTYEVSNGITLKTFTFVRDPLDHFVSGLSHSIFFTFHPPPLIAPLNMTTIQRYYDNFLFGDWYELQFFDYALPMSGTYFRLQPDIVGRLETFDHDWKNIIMPTYGLLSPYDFNLGDHPTSVNHPRKHGNDEVNRDPMNVRASLQDLWRTHPKYLRSLCYLLLIDYVCLPLYSLPPGCEYLEPLRMKAAQAVKLGVKLDFEV